MGKSEVGNSSTKLGAIPDQNKDFRYGSSVSMSRNFYREIAMGAMRRIGSFTNSMQIKIGIVLQILTTRENGFDEI